MKVSVTLKMMVVSQRLNEENVEENPAKLKSIVETILLCGRQGQSLGGHKDDHKSQENDPLHIHKNF